MMWRQAHRVGVTLVTVPSEAMPVTAPSEVTPVTVQLGAVPPEALPLGRAGMEAWRGTHRLGAKQWGAIPSAAIQPEAARLVTLAVCLAVEAPGRAEPTLAARVAARRRTCSKSACTWRAKKTQDTLRIRNTASLKYADASSQPAGV